MWGGRWVGAWDGAWEGSEAQVIEPPVDPIVQVGGGYDARLGGSQHADRQGAGQYPLTDGNRLPDRQRSGTSPSAAKPPTEQQSIARKSRHVDDIVFGSSEPAHLSGHELSRVTPDASLTKAFAAATAEHERLTQSAEAVLNFDNRNRIAMLTAILMLN